MSCQRSREATWLASACPNRVRITFRRKWLKMLNGETRNRFAVEVI